MKQIALSVAFSFLVLPLLWKMMRGLWFFPSFYSAMRCCREEKANSHASVSWIFPLFQDLYVNVNASICIEDSGLCLTNNSPSLLEVQDFCCLDSFQLLENIPPRFWVAVTRCWNKSSPKEDLDLHLSICSVSVLDPVCKNFFLRFNRKVVLPGVEAEQCWHRLRFFWCENTSIHLQKKICSFFSFMSLTVENTFRLLPFLPPYTLWFHLSLK